MDAVLAVRLKGVVIRATAVLAFACAGYAWPRVAVRVVLRQRAHGGPNTGIGQKVRGNGLCSNLSVRI